jgi:hypothetical protein
LKCLINLEYLHISFHECKIEIKNSIELLSKTKGFVLIENIANNAQYVIGYIYIYIYQISPSSFGVCCIKLRENFVSLAQNYLRFTRLLY